MRGLITSVHSDDKCFNLTHSIWLWSLLVHFIFEWECAFNESSLVGVEEVHKGEDSTTKISKPVA